MAFGRTRSRETHALSLIQPLSFKTTGHQRCGAADGEEGNIVREQLRNAT